MSICSDVLLKVIKSFGFETLLTLTQGLSKYLLTDTQNYCHIYFTMNHFKKRLQSFLLTGQKGSNSIQLFWCAHSVRMTVNGMLCHSLGEEAIFFFWALIAPSLNLMPCLSSWLEIIACLHSWGMREAIGQLFEGKHFLINSGPCWIWGRN